MEEKSQFDRIITYVELQSAILPPQAVDAKWNGRSVAFGFDGKIQPIRERQEHSSESIATELLRNFESGITFHEEFNTAVKNLVRLGCAIELQGAYFQARSSHPTASKVLLREAMFFALDECRKRGDKRMLRYMYETAFDSAFSEQAGKNLFELLFGKKAVRELERKYPDLEERSDAMASLLRRQYAEDLSGMLEARFKKPKGSLAYISAVEKDLKSLGMVTHATRLQKQ